jgi:tetratricopeptide (TPR) repeat protein
VTRKGESQVDHDARLLFVLLRHYMNLDQAGFAAAIHTAPSQVSIYERGLRSVPEPVLLRAMAAAGLSQRLLQPAKRAIRSFRVAAKGLTSAQRLLSEAFFFEFLELADEALSILAPAGRAPRRLESPGPGSDDRCPAEALWNRLQVRNPHQRLALVEELEEFQSWKLCALVAAKSIEAAPSSPADALELAHLALRIAEICPGEMRLRQRAQGYAWFHVANARKAANDLPGCEVALANAKSLWKADLADEPGLFSQALVLGLESTIRYWQRRFPEAMRQVEAALNTDRGEIRGKLLLLKAQILTALGEVNASTEVLREAASGTCTEREPRISLGIRCELLGNLCLQGRASEAAQLFSEVQALAEELSQEVDLVHVGFIAGQIAAGTGQVVEAEMAFEQAREKFSSFKPPLVFDYALVSLHLALLLLEQGRTSETQEVAEEMSWIFANQGVEQGVLSALQIFCEAASRETATAELARRVIRFLHRAQHDSDLSFEAG